ncbi:FAD-dependent oxidoreductase [Microbacterium aoyamense]|uniref:FAD-dependent oxidoreductase n=1 Tax=Microbacterium aoyamense TaxID=344166 RepID=A0ABN2PW22_9MICO|nr:FAD-dependent oxidoreductase [Microbacterium aoyamense]
MTSAVVSDVLVLGAGASGAAAAITAAREGRSVTVLEAAAADRHTPNVRMSGGWVMTTGDVAEGLSYLRGCADGLVDDDVLRMWAAESANLYDWLLGLGVELQESDGVRGPEHPRVPGAHSIGIRRSWTALRSPIDGQGGWFDPEAACLGGEALYRGLMTGLLASGADIRWGARAERLLVEDGAIAGAVATIDGEEREFRAASVVIATGGFGGSRDLVVNFIDVPNTEFYGNPLNRGDGLRLAMSVGADIVRMNRFIGRGVAAFDDVQSGLRVGFILNLDGGGYAIVDSAGRRYMNEIRQARLAHDVLYEMQEFDPAAGAYTRSPSYYFFDQRRMDAGPLTYPDRGVTAVGLYEWSVDNRKEVDSGWIATGATPLEAAVAAGAEPSDEFDRAIAEYNAACATGEDPLGRPVDSLVPLQAPFYCVPLYVGGPHTTGGPRRDARGRVLGVLDGEPIAGLLSAGELGQAVGLLYPVQGCSLSDALCSGIVAGRTAAGVV